MPNARTKLNAIAVYGCLAVAVVVGLVTESWIVFVLTAVGLVGLALQTGGIRPGPRRRR